MKSKLASKWFFWVLLLALATAATRSLPAADAARPVSEYQRSNSSVSNVFRSVVAEAAKSTVSVLSNGKQTALGGIISADGYIVTKASELSGNLECKLADGRKLKATIVGIHRDSDLAMLKVDADGLPAVHWIDSDVPSIGSWLATTGLGRDPEAIGVVSVVPRKIEAPSGVLGIMLEEDERGPRIDQVMPGSGAEKAGLQVNDIVVSVDGKVVKTRDSLIEFVRQHQPGEKLRVSVNRGDKAVTVVATLGDRAQGPGSERADFQNGLGGELSDRRGGFPSVLQHDSVLRPNQCGGPIVDLDGHAVGINIARAGRVASYALPVTVIRPLLDDLRSGNLSPTAMATKRIAELKSSLTALKQSETDLGQRLAESLESVKKAKEAEAAAKTGGDDLQAALKKAQEQTAAAEKAADQLKAELARAVAEVKVVEAEKSSLEIELRN